MNIYMAGYAGSAYAYKLYKENKNFVNERFPDFFVRRIEALRYDSEKTEDRQISLAKIKDYIYICEINHGGVFAALWSGCKKLGCGCEVFLEKIPIRQETVEVSELFGENPYETDSFGSLLIFSESDHLPEAFTYIGKTTENNDRVVIYKDNKRFLTPPERQDRDRQQESRQR